MSGKRFKNRVQKSKVFGVNFKIDARFCIVMLVVLLFVVFLFNVFLNFVASLFLFPFVILFGSYSVIVLLNYRKERVQNMRHLFRKLGASSRHDYKILPACVLACSYDGTILWCNNFFEKSVEIGDGFVGSNFSDMFGEQLSVFCKDEGSSVCLRQIGMLNILLSLTENVIWIL